MARVLEPEVMDGDDEAAVYDELDRMWGDVVFQGFAESAARMGVRQGRVLDVGTGTGRLAIRLARLNPELTIEAIDLSSGMLELARVNAAREGTDNVRFCLGDAKHLKYQDESFDLVICHQLLHHFADPLAPLKEMNRVAKRQGALLVCDVRRLPKPLMDLAIPVWCLGYSDRLRELTAASFRAGLNVSGFREIARKAGIPGARHETHWLTHQSLGRTAVPYQAVDDGAWPASPWLKGAIKSLYVRRPAR